jgi:TolB protein
MSTFRRSRFARLTACLTVAIATLVVGGLARGDDAPGANGQIAFASSRDGNSEIYVMNADGSGQTRLTTNAAVDGGPSWSPDGTRIAFQTNRDGNLEVYVMSADGSGQTRLTTNAATDTQPSWSPDGTNIAFGSLRDGNFEVYVMSADGSGQTRLTTNAAIDVGPSWSPDGTKIAFTSSRDGNPKVFVMNADGSGQTRLTSNAAPDTTPAWSPDGQRISFQSLRDGNSELYVMSADGSGQTRLTNDAAFDGTATWSPDGGQLAFQSNRDGNSEIYVVAADGSGPTNVTNNPAPESFPDWHDTTPPVVTVPADIAAEATGPGGATVSFSASAFDNVEVATFGCMPPSGSLFPIAVTTVHCSATDAVGNNSSKTFTVAVVDTTGPVITGVSQDKTVVATGSGGAMVTYASPTADDLVDGPRPVACVPESGSTFPVAVTKVICSATDSRGNTASATFNVTVQPTAHDQIVALASLVSALPSLSGQHENLRKALLHDLEQADKSLAQAQQSLSEDKVKDGKFKQANAELDQFIQHVQRNSQNVDPSNPISAATAASWTSAAQQIQAAIQAMIA